RRYETKPGSPSSPELSEILKELRSGLSESLKVPLCESNVLLDSLIANWISDILLHAYDESVNLKAREGADGVLFGTGALRGDSQYGPGIITLGNIMEILPFLNVTVCIEIDGATLWDALENGFSKYPSDEGRFPAISGFRVSWDSRREPGQRVLGIWMTKEVDDGDNGTQLVDGEPVQRTKDGKKYAIVTLDFDAQGNDGYTMLKGSNYLVDNENGQILSTLVRKYLLGSHFVNQVTRTSADNSSAIENLNEDTKKAIKHEHHHRCRHKNHRDVAADVSQEAISEPDSKVHKHGQQRRSGEHYKIHLHVACTERMDCVDPVDGKKFRRRHHPHGLEGVGVQEFERKQSVDKEIVNQPSEEDLLVISPVIDGRIQDEARK
ncbi:5'-nucleotidase, partial [Dendrothele bispora CBS 962.96]